jgi:hypothetical protein
MLNIKTLLPELKKLVTDLSEDLLARSTAKDDPYSVEVDAGLREAYTQIEKGGRTAQAFEVWREDYLDQVAVAWVLGCVFVRFMEDNHLIDECRLAGEGDRRKLAEDTHELYFREHPHESDREYFEHVFHEIGKIPACRDLFAEGKTPLWAVGPSGDAAMKLLAFWKDVVPESGELSRSFEVEDNDTRFLGDLYQDLSERARKKYALLQTPVFVEEFILERTLNPAIDEFGLDEVRMIDPTCGSGHFLLGGFARLFDLWIKREDNEIVAAQKALDGVWGVDINPFAVAIARFRLIVAALSACGIKRLKGAPAWNIHLATGDSLLFGSRWDRHGDKKAEQQFLGTDEESWAPEIYACEDKEALSEVLGQQYHAVVGNPPYITVKDKRLNQAYRDRYSTCHKKYSLSVPFAERFFDLAVKLPNSISGFVGQITANSFMKREFGKKLIEEFLPKIDLTHVVDTSGAYIPGHGTPTVLLFGRNRKPFSDVIRAVLGIEGEPSTPANPAEGQVWRSVLRHIDSANSEDRFVSSTDVPRAALGVHPWSLSGGGASELKQHLENGRQTLGEISDSIGFMAITGEDAAYVRSRHQWRLHGTPTLPYVEGNRLRDWCCDTDQVSPFVYSFDNNNVNVLPIDEMPELLHELWPLRAILRSRLMFGKTPEESGLSWYEYRFKSDGRLRNSFSIAFAFVATHNHFFVNRGGRVFNRSAPIITLDNDSTESDHVALTGLLNSSTACFWLKQTFHNKGSTVDQHGARQRTAPFEDFYEFTGTGLQRFPIPETKPVELAKQLETSAQEFASVRPESVIEKTTITEDALSESHRRWSKTFRRMVALQEELDWHCYKLYRLLDDTLTHEGDELPEIRLGERAFEILLARLVASGNLQTTWFDRHGSSPITDLPSDWPQSYQQLVESRIEAIKSNKNLELIEKPEFKRRWNTESWNDQQSRALEVWLLNRLESSNYWPTPESNALRLQSISELADRAGGDREFLEVAAIYRGREGFDVTLLVTELVLADSVPLLPKLRFKAGGLRKRQLWEKTWELQRKEDAGEKVGKIKVPPKYTSADFQSSDNWRLRGKLDVPKERWISFPNCETESDPSLVVGWAGWNHLQQATALIAYYDARKREGWDAKRLTPLLAGLDQLLPWIHQWHPEVDPEFGETAGQSFQTMLEADTHALGLTLEDIRTWEPPSKKPRRKRKTK